MRLRRTWNQILERLRAEGGPLPAPEPVADPPAGEAESPWFVRALAAVGAWVSALFLLGCVAIAIRSEKAHIPIGALGIGAGFFLLRRDTGEFLRQFGLSLSVAGQLTVAIGLGHLLDYKTAFSLVALLIEAVLLVLIAHPIHRFLSALMAAAAAVALLVALELPAAIDLAALGLAAGAGLLWIDEPRRRRATGFDGWSPVGYALVLALYGVLLLVAATGGESGRWLLHGPLTAGRIASGGLGLATVSLALRIRLELGFGRQRPTPLLAAGLAALALLGLVTPAAPGVAAASGGLLLALHRRNPVLLGLAVVFLILFLSLLYYNMTASLLTKAVSLMAAGLALASAAWVLQRRGVTMSRRQALAVWGGLALVLGMVNVSAARKEWLRARGQPLLLELAPRDPRSLMQGDYMTLDYAIERALTSHTGAGGALVVRVDGRGVASFARLAGPDETLAPAERLLRYRRREGRARVGPDAFFFQEGQSERFAPARFGDLRADAGGNALLVGLRDAEGRPLPR